MIFNLICFKLKIRKRYFHKKFNYSALNANDLSILLTDEDIAK